MNASFPSSARTWQVNYIYPNTGDNGVMVYAQCQCLTNRDLVLGMQRKGSDDVTLPGTDDWTHVEYLLPDYRMTDIDVLAPSGATVTGGGYITSPQRSDPPDTPSDQQWVASGTYNGGIVASRPLVDGNGRAIGWHVRQFSCSPTNQPFTRAYVLYATQGLEPTTVSDRTLSSTPAYNADYFDGIADDLEPTDFCPSGGYEFVDRRPSAGCSESRLFHARDVMTTAIDGGGAGWRAKAWSMISDNDCYERYFKAFAIHAKVPPKYYITVNIVDPAEDAKTIYLDDPVTAQAFSFRAEATDLDGTPIPDDRLRWTLDTPPSGFGQTSSTGGGTTFQTSFTFPMDQGFQVWRRVRVTATGQNGESAFDEVLLIFVHAPHKVH